MSIASLKKKLKILIIKDSYLTLVGKRKRGRPKTTWRRTVEKERAEAGWRSWDEARVAAANRKNGEKLLMHYVPSRVRRRQVQVQVFGPWI